jgi:dolichol-phosphate mannosyltransferase
MSLVSLVLPIPPGATDPVALIPGLAVALESAGHEVEVVAVLPPGTDAASHPLAATAARLVVAELPGQAAAAVAGLERASGDVILVLDPNMGYRAEDLPRVVEPLRDGRAELVVASRFAAGTGRLRAALGALAKPLVGTSDPFSGLVGLTREALESARRFHAVGSKFSFELLAKLDRRDGLRRLDLAVRRGRPTLRGRLGWDDVRHLKRLADHRYGNLSRLVQFCVVGASGMVVDLSLYATFQWVFSRTALAGRELSLGGWLVSAPLAAAAVVAVSCALVWNFSLNRRLTFNDARGGKIFRQFLTYALSNAVSVPLSLFLRLWLPGSVAFFHAHRLAAAVVGIVAGTAVSFSMSRWLVFRQQPTPSPPPGPYRKPASHRSSDSRRTIARR